jgi:CDP-diacylglycerol--glycerol-3-phosphate 3-phosphatidyltransferase
MTVPMMLTGARIVLAPVFFLFYQLAERGSPFVLLGVWGIFGIIEVSDLLDGYYARRLGLESELGKVLDPFADSISRLTYFLAFVGSGLLPLWIFLILIYRDVSVAYIRVMLSHSRVLMPARTSGKLKAWIYAVAGIGGLAAFSQRKLGWLVFGSGLSDGIAFWLFVIAGAVALWSLTDYAHFFIRNFRRTS